MRFPMSAKAYANFDPVTKVFVRFGSEKAGVLLLSKTFGTCMRFVAEKVMPRFKCFFPE